MAALDRRGLWEEALALLAEALPHFPVVIYIYIYIYIYV